jgi:hypothetical protein
MTDATGHPEPQLNEQRALKAAAWMRRALLLALLLWVAVRIVEFSIPQSDPGKPLLSMYHIGWMAWIAVMLGVTGYLIPTGFLVYRARQVDPSLFRVAAGWAGILVLFLLIGIFFTGYRISALGFLGTFLGLEVTAQEAVYSLARFYPLFPTLSLHGLLDPDPEQRHVIWLSQLPAWMSVIPATGTVMLWLTGRRGIFRGRFFSFCLLLLSAATVWLLLTQFGVVRLRGAAGQVSALLLAFTPATGLLAIVISGFGLLRDYARQNSGTALKLDPPGSGFVALTLLIAAPVLGDIENVHSIERQLNGFIARPAATASPPPKTRTKVISTPPASRKPATTGTHIVTASRLNVRSGPGVTHSDVGTLLRGQTVTVHQRSGDWARIGPGRWVSYRYLQNLR